MKKETKNTLLGALLILGLLTIGGIVGGAIVHSLGWNVRDAAIKIIDVENNEPILDGSMSPGSVFQYDNIRVYVFDPDE